MTTPEQAYEQYVERAYEEYVGQAYEEYVQKQIAERDAASNFELVLPDRACADCGERRMDWLVWTDDAINVKCATCGLVFRPGGSQ